MVDWIADLETGPTGREPIEDRAVIRPLKCLVLADDRSRAEIFATAARRGGWTTTVCQALAAARHQTEHTLFWLAMLDFETAADERKDAYRSLGEHLSASSDVLVAVCGDEAGDAALEIWARQLGVWLFMPGLPDSASLTEICTEALQLARRMIAPASHPEGARVQTSRPVVERTESPVHRQTTRRAVGRLAKVPRRRRTKPFRRRN